MAGKAAKGLARVVPPDLLRWKGPEEPPRQNAGEGSEIFSGGGKALERPVAGGETVRRGSFFINGITLLMNDENA